MLSSAVKAITPPMRTGMWLPWLRSGLDEPLCYLSIAYAKKVFYVNVNLYAEVWVGSLIQQSCKGNEIWSTQAE